jgi:hypothetical protein
MPTIIRIRGFRVFMWPGDHIPPHFHVLGAGYAARISLEGLRILDEKGKRPACMADILAWAGEHGDLLEKAWADLSREGIA